MESCWELGGGSGGVVDAHKPVPAPFLTKTYHLVDDPSTDHIVSWGDDRVSTFVVWRPPEFARDLLPNYFKHNNFSSFVRQLNTYGFRKVVPERWEFANEFFRKGEKHLLCEIHRRKTSSSSTLPIPSPPLFPFYHHPHFDEHHLAAAAPRWRDAPSPRLLALGGMSSGCTSTSSAGIEVGRAGQATAAALLEENERLRRSNATLLSELSHMRKLYNDIIYFVQNHVRPVAPSSAAAASANLLSGGGATVSAYQRRSGRNSGSTTSSSSLTIAEEPSPPPTDNKNSCNGESSGDTTTVRPKLFGVTLDGVGWSNNKRGWQVVDDVEPTSPSTKPRLTLDKDDLGLNLVSPPPTC